MNSNVKYLDSIFTRLFLRFDTAHDFANSKTDNPITRDFINDAIGDNLEKTYPILSGE